MSEGSNIADQVLSLPQGGGAVSGLGEKFSPDLQTGTGNFTIPITLPPGRNNLEPKLDLVYSTGHGNGPFGLGWSLTLPSVKRKTSKGIPRYDDAKDVFLLAGVEDLVPLAKQGSEAGYRPRTENTFARISHIRDVENDYWRVQSADGLIAQYGSRQSIGEDPAVIADPADRHHAFAWKLTETRDPFGNRIRYVYERDSAEEGPRHWDQLYLSQVLYADHGDPEQPEFAVSVSFDYEARPDPFSDYRAGFEIRTVKRCRRITVRTHLGQMRVMHSYELTYLDQRTELEDLASRLPQNGVTLLNRVQLIGHDGDDEERMPPLDLDYSRFEPGREEFLAVQGPALPAISLADDTLELADLSGNGLPDLVEVGNGFRYWPNLGQGRFGWPRWMKNAPAGLSLADPEVRLVDADGDGRIDLMVAKESFSGTFPLSFDGTWDERSFRPFRQAPSFDLADPQVRLVDLDGDGVIDAIRAGPRYQLFFNDPRRGWLEQHRPRRDELEGPPTDFSDPRVRWADMSGDGLQDLVLVHDGSIKYWPHLGYGRWGHAIAMLESPRLPFGHDPGRLLLGDVDGDGVADLVYVDQGKVTVWINRSGNRWSEPIEVVGTPAVSDFDTVRLVDLLGRGVQGVLWSRDASSTGPHLHFLDLTAGIKPYLLDEVQNSLGASTRIEYQSSTSCCMQDAQSGTPWKTPLPFPVQVVARVETFDHLSGGKLVTGFHYHHGYWDGAEREFRGFGRVDQIDTETFAAYNQPGLHRPQWRRGRADSGDEAEPIEGQAKVELSHYSPPTLTKTWFHVGPIGDEHGEWSEPDYRDEYWPGDSPLLERSRETAGLLRSLPRRARRDALRTMRGSVQRTELYALDGDVRQGRPYTVTESQSALWQVVESDDGHRLSTGRQSGDLPALWDGNAAPRVFLSRSVAQRTTRWERGDDPLTHLTFSDDLDSLGRPRSETSVACPRGWRHLDTASSPEDTPAPFLITQTRRFFARSPRAGLYLESRLAAQSLYALENDGSRSVLELRALPASDPAYRLIGQSRTYYDGEAFVGLPLGELGDFGAPVRTENLVLLDSDLTTALDGSERPPYLDPGAGPDWGESYPQAFRDPLPTLAGYRHDSVHLPRESESNAGSTGTIETGLSGFFAAERRSAYDFHRSDGGHRGLAEIERDPLGNDSTIEYDPIGLLPIRITDPAGLETSVTYDERLLQPLLATDPNGNRTRYGYTPLGNLATLHTFGRPGENVGDSDEAPGTRFTYDLQAFFRDREPISVRISRRIHHALASQTADERRDDAIEAIDYSDGFGRLLQGRRQAEDLTYEGGLPADQEDGAAAARPLVATRQGGTEAPVVVSGWQVYDNKGRIVRKYEPFFDRGWAFDGNAGDLEGAAERAQPHVTFFYDPLGRKVRTVLPDGSEERTIHGRPNDLGNPESFEPTPWRVFSYDPNDNAGRTGGPGDVTAGDVTVDTKHWNTPSSAELDALGRTVTAVVRNGPDPERDWLVSRSVFDIRGGLLAAIDAAGRTAFRYLYDLAGRGLRVESLDGGTRLTFFNAAGHAIEERDSKGALRLTSHDLLQRTSSRWARDGTAGALTLRQRWIYGDRGDPRQAAGERQQQRQVNRLGRLDRHFDEAGLCTFELYDLAGRPVEKSRRTIDDRHLIAAFETPPLDWRVTPFRVDWQRSDPESLLAPETYESSMDYDALGRLTRVQYPRDVSGERKTVVPGFNRAGALESVTVDGEVFVRHIAYNARGRRTFVAFGNGILTRYAYDPSTYRLARLRSESYRQPTPLTFEPIGRVLQDQTFTFDPVGNLLRLDDRAPGSGLSNTLEGLDRLLRLFTYDPLYRLSSTSGREHSTIGSSPSPWHDQPKPLDPSRTRAYRRTYTYDSVGNFLELRHSAANGSFTRRFEPNTEGNRLDSLTIGETSFSYGYDLVGNTVTETTSRHFEWDAFDRLLVFRNQTEGAEPSVYAHYLYDSHGQRVKKCVRKAGGVIETTVNIDNVFEHHRRLRGQQIRENNLLFIVDDKRRLAELRIGPAFENDATPAVKYMLSDHLGSSQVVVGDQGSFINREEFTPYGETSFGGFARKRFRFCGKERDEESGLGYHAARYYAPWLGRWASCDPAGISDGLHSYRYAHNNPNRFTDNSGLGIVEGTEGGVVETPPWSYTRMPAKTPDGDWSPAAKEFLLSRGMDPNWAEDGPPPEAPDEEGWGSFLEGALGGSFSDNTTWSAVGGHTALSFATGFTPFGPVLDARDIVADVINVAQGKDGAGLDLAISIAAIAPGADALKLLKGFKAGAPKMLGSAVVPIFGAIGTANKKIWAKRAADLAADAGLKLKSVRWTKKEIEAFDVYQDVYFNTAGETAERASKAGKAFHDHLGMAPNGADRVLFGVTDEIKTKSSHLPVETIDMNKAIDQVKNYAGDGPFRVIYFELGTQNKYIITK